MSSTTSIVDTLIASPCGSPSQILTISASIFRPSSVSTPVQKPFFFIKDLTHSVQIKKTGVQCTTDLRLVRDSHGEKTESTTSPSLGFDPLTNSYSA